MTALNLMFPKENCGQVIETLTGEEVKSTIFAMLNALCTFWERFPSTEENAMQMQNPCSVF